MSDSTLPSWLNEDLPSTSSESKTQPQTIHKPQPHSTSQSVQHPGSNAQESQPLPLSLRKKREAVFWGCKIATVFLCCLMAVTACMGVASVDGIDDSGEIMVAIYMIIFAAILALFEVIQIKPCESIDHVYRRNFGFLYGTKGKAFFIIFVAFLSFGLKEPANLCLMTGISVAVFGVFELGLYLKYPELFEDEIR
mmetsp:Transcript_26602/g.39529  ORF Transcript_26602/g.39529 Transcript_26602/m.39529 type:complete len:195 (+) Transcript_26602:47-631(+)